MASAVFTARHSAKNIAGMEKFRTDLKEILKHDSMLVDNGLFIGSVMEDPVAFRHPKVSLLIQCWETADEELEASVRYVMKNLRFRGLSVIGLD